MAEKEMQNIEIEADGDVIFVCPHGLETTRRYRVSSTVVSRASPVFKAMLRPHFKEGSTLLKDSRVEIELPDDDAWAMEIIFNIMHLQNDCVESQLDVNGLEVIAQLVDKYQCATAIAPVVYYIMVKQVDTTTVSMKDLGRMLDCAYFCHQHELFERICQRLILEASEPIRSDSSRVPDVFAALEDQRMGALLSLSAFVQKDMLDSCNIRRQSWASCTLGCTFQDNYAVASLRRLGKLELWPIPNAEKNSVQNILESMRKVLFEESMITNLQMCESTFTSCVGNSLCPRIISDARTKKYHTKAAETENGIRKFCLRCTRKGKVFGPEHLCTHEGITFPFAAKGEE
ncbi:hypothetical protein AC578_3681 [Pseudocercospora eumusae]|uniref:BTB domain-containing protein n=1 Tax=Pseudocercospora eumusae TaxID=321146 RepID=A0A139HST9_9PEZI|nr:hypothetical protein AC578_3681 [Pseudocercospora eumusae]